MVKLKIQGNRLKSIVLSQSVTEASWPVSVLFPEGYSWDTIATVMDQIPTSKCSSLKGSD